MFFSIFCLKKNAILQRQKLETFICVEKFRGWDRFQGGKERSSPALRKTPKNEFTHLSKHVLIAAGMLNKTRSNEIKFRPLVNQTDYYETCVMIVQYVGYNSQT